MTDLCLWCEEPVLAGEEYDVVMHVGAGGVAERRMRHWVCSARSVLGGLNHLRGLCTCCGGSEPPDPPELSRREAARQALTYARRSMK